MELTVNTGNTRSVEESVAGEASSVTRGGETAWLSESEQAAWRHYLRGARALETALDRELLAHGMSLAEYEILSMLSESEGRRLRMSALATIVVQSRSRLTHTANRLERRGWVERQPCLDDSRGVELVLTEDGLQALHEAAKVHVASVRAFMVDVMPARQFASLGDAMRRVGEAVEASER